VAAGEGVKLRAGDGAGEGTAVRGRDDLVSVTVKDKERALKTAKGGQIVESIANQEARGKEAAGQGGNAGERGLED
jgi:hypothetical protein